MKLDYDTGKPLELQAIYENSLKIAKKNGVSMPLTYMLYAQLAYLTGQRQFDSLYFNPSSDLF